MKYLPLIVVIFCYLLLIYFIWKELNILSKPKNKDKTFPTITPKEVETSLMDNHCTDCHCCCDHSKSDNK